METKTVAKLQHIAVDQLHTFRNHPFAVRHDEAMEQLVESIRVNGVLNPVLARPKADGDYEIIAGHRRTEASRILKNPTVPCFVCEMEDDPAIIAMIDSNLSQREKLPISEKVFALKMRAEAARRLMLSQSGRSDIKRASENVSKETGISSRQIERLIKLGSLNRQFLNMLDDGKLTMDTGGQLAYLSTEEQCWVYDFMKEKSIAPSTAQAKQMRELSVRNELTQEKVAEILLPRKPVRRPAPMSEKQVVRPEIPAQNPVEIVPAAMPAPLPVEEKPMETIVQTDTPPTTETSLPVLDYLRISRYYPPNTTVEFMNDDICQRLEAAKRHRLYRR